MSYQQTKRIDKIRNWLVDGIAFNSTTLCAQFKIDIRTAARDMSFVKKEYPGKIGYDYFQKSFYLKS